VVSGDDCFALKGNSTYVTIENVYCQNSHGVSVGSLAQYPGVLDIVEHVKVVNIIASPSVISPKTTDYISIQKNITFVGNGDGSSNGARIKVWAGPVGSAIVNDVHYEDLSVCIPSSGNLRLVFHVSNADREREQPNRGRLVLF
jgi:galacturan 1,4-alpha-galacturonidase